MEVKQSNTMIGRLPIPSAASLVGKEARLAVLGTTGVNLPGAITDRPLYVIDEGGEAGENSEVIPLDPSRNIRVRAKGVGARGDALTLAAIAGDDAGKLRALPTANGTYHVVAIAEEAFVDGQLVLCRPTHREAIVVSG